MAACVRKMPVVSRPDIARVNPNCFISMRASGAWFV